MYLNAASRRRTTAPSTPVTPRGNIVTPIKRDTGQKSRCMIEFYSTVPTAVKEITNGISGN